VVHRARHRALHRLVAIKVLLVDDPATIARFERELQLTVQVGHQHPHIVTVLDSGRTTQGRPAALGDQLRATGPLPSADVLRIGRTIADAPSPIVKASCAGT
jgi:serine/threonine protein kinase